MSPECTCETFGHCLACRPREIHPLRMSDAEFDAWIDTRTPEQHDETMDMVHARFDEPAFAPSPKHRAIYDAMTGLEPGDQLDARWTQPDNPSRLTAEASRLWVEAVAYYG